MSASDKELISEYVFRLDGISQDITARVYRDFSPPQPNDPFFYATSHAIKTPEQLTAYLPGAPWGSDPEYLMERAVESVAYYHRAAQENGHAPSEDWLIPNADF